MPWYARTAVLLALLSLTAQAAGAQGLWDSLFGPEEAVPSRPASGYVRVKPASPLFDELFSPAEHDVSPPDVRPATYRTVCVRMCDGFYFPISSAASSANFTHDAEKCAASCSGARLFYAPNSGRDIGGMLDLTGRAYASYPIAFKYRKTLVEGCQCRPQPWTEAERARHRAYAATQTPGGQYSTPIKGAQAETAAAPPVQRDFEDFSPRTPGSSPPHGTPFGFSAQDDLRAIDRPTPVYRQLQSGQWDWFFDTAPPVLPRSRYDRPLTP